MGFRAVIFDLGGVVLPSPFTAFRAYERRQGLPHQFVSEVVVAGGEHGAWSRFERGELDPDAFATAFEAECAAAGETVVVADLFAEMGAGGGGPHPRMVDAIGAIRARGLRTAALTNNWIAADGPTPLVHLLDGLFDTIVESAREGLRKPDPRIYALTCTRLGIAAHESVFLDDIGANLKPARAMGMATVKVEDPAVALDELAGLLGFPLGGTP
ncbi:MAG: HAD-IA family hydrolase [Actinomycetota bacterium]